MLLSVEFHLASSFVSLTFSWDGQCTKPVVRGGGLNKYQGAPADYKLLEKRNEAFDCSHSVSRCICSSWVRHLQQRIASNPQSSKIFEYCCLGTTRRELPG